MAIKWNKVTWYSKLLAVIIFVATFYIGFHLGNIQGQQKPYAGTSAANTTTTPQKSPITAAPLSISSQNIKEENFSGKMPIISGTSAVAVKARSYVEQKIAEFRKQANDDVPDMRAKFGADSPVSQYTIDMDAKDIQSEKTESIVMSIYAYTGGANGNSSYKVITAVRPNGKVLSLADKIIKEKQVAFTNFVKKELNDWRSEASDGPVVFTDEVKDLKFDSFTNWSLDDKNLTIYFDKYQIGAGYLGAVAFPLPLDKIKDFLK